MTIIIIVIIPFMIITILVIYDVQGIRGVLGIHGVLRVHLLHEGLLRYLGLGVWSVLAGVRRVLRVLTEKVLALVLFGLIKIIRSRQNNATAWPRPPRRPLALALGAGALARLFFEDGVRGRRNLTRGANARRAADFL